MARDTAGRVTLAARRRRRSSSCRTRPYLIPGTAAPPALVFRNLDTQNGRCVWRWVDAENVPIRTMKVSRKRAKIGARAGPIWHYVALRGTRAPPTCTRVHARSKDLWDRHVVPSRARRCNGCRSPRRGSPWFPRPGKACTLWSCQWTGSPGEACDTNVAPRFPMAAVTFKSVPSPMTTENVTNRTVKAPLKTGQNAAPGGISRPQLALRGTSLEH